MRQKCRERDHKRRGRRQFAPHRCGIPPACSSVKWLENRREYRKSLRLGNEPGDFLHERTDRSIINRKTFPDSAFFHKIVSPCSLTTEKGVPSWPLDVAYQSYDRASLPLLPFLPFSDSFRSHPPMNSCSVRAKICNSRKPKPINPERYLPSQPSSKKSPIRKRTKRSPTENPKKRKERNNRAITKPISFPGSYRKSSKSNENWAIPSFPYTTAS